MKSYRRLLGLGIVLSVTVIFSALIVQGLFSPSIVEGAGSRDLSGFAWSSNIGWVSFKGTWSNPITGTSGNYGVELTSDNKFIKYAWSSNIGWISFYDNTGTPPSGNANDAGVRLLGNGNVEGWARACSVFKNDTEANRCKGELKPPEERGGWDGWISMNCSNTNSCAASDYKVSYNPSTSQLTDFAWGADVVGWIDFCANAATGACVTIDNLNVRCTANDLENGGVVSINPPSTDTVTWQASVIPGGVPPYDYTYCWGDGGDGPGGLCDPPQGGSVNAITNTVTASYPTAQTVTGNVGVKDSTSGKTGIAICSIEVKDLSNPTLSVYVTGGDEKGKVDAGATPVPVAGSISNCRTSTGSCTANYAVNSSVTLTASPGNNPNTVPPNQSYEFSWSEPGCASNVSPCVVTVGAEGKSVTVTFYDQTSVVPTFDPPSPGVISIEFHSAGQPAESNKSTLTLTSSQAVELCVDSFKSFTGNTIKSIIDAIPGNHPPVECLLGGLPGSCSNTPPNCVNVNPGGSTTFSVLVPEKLIEILNNSPYFIRLRASGILLPTPIRFEYRVRDIRP